MKLIKTGDYVVATSDINGVKKRSVGLVKNVSGKEIAVLFIGADKLVKTDSRHVAYLDVKKPVNHTIKRYATYAIF